MASEEPANDVNENFKIQFCFYEFKYQNIINYRNMFAGVTTERRLKSYPRHNQTKRIE